MLAIIQGLYILREDEDEEFEKRRQEAIQRIRAERGNWKNAPDLKDAVPEIEGYTCVSVFFVAIFMGLIGYLIYFNTVKSDDFINSPYNTRQDTFSDRVVRGKYPVLRRRSTCSDQCFRRRNRRAFLSLWKYICTCRRI